MAKAPIISGVACSIVVLLTYVVRHRYGASAIGLMALAATTIEGLTYAVAAGAGVSLAIYAILAVLK